MDNESNKELALFIIEATKHIHLLHNKHEIMLGLCEAISGKVLALRDRIDVLERENERLKKELEHLSLLN